MRHKLWPLAGQGSCSRRQLVLPTGRSNCRRSLVGSQTTFHQRKSVTQPKIMARCWWGMPEPIFASAERRPNPMTGAIGQLSSKLLDYLPVGASIEVIRASSPEGLC